MKKTLVMAMAAVCMMASCKKNPLPTPEDQTPVAVEFSTNRIDATVSQTKAPVTTWNGEKLHIYGFKVNRGTDGTQKDLGDERYTFDSPFINNVQADAPMGGGSDINVYRTGTEPYYYSINTNDVYDFYGYYYGDAHLGTVTMNDDAISYPVTITGTQDLMYATTDKTVDVAEATPGSTVAIHQAYGAWAARRGVHPTLNFKHALSQFKFSVKRGVGGYTGDLTIKSIDIVTPTQGTFTVVGENLGFVETPDAAGTQKVTTAPSTGLTLDEASEGDDASVFGDPLMIGPGKTSIKVVVTMQATDYTAGSGASNNEITHEMIIQSAALTGTGATTDMFKGGYSYDVTLIVYGPEQVKFDVTLADWTSGGTLVFDPDNGVVGPEA